MVPKVRQGGYILSCGWMHCVKKVRVNGRIVSITARIVCGVEENDHRDIIVVKPMAKESTSSYGVLSQDLKNRGLATPKQVISDAT